MKRRRKASRIQPRVQLGLALRLLADLSLIGQRADQLDLSVKSGKSWLPQGGPLCACGPVPPDDAHLPLHLLLDRCRQPEAPVRLVKRGLVQKPEVPLSYLPMLLAVRWCAPGYPTVIFSECLKQGASKVSEHCRP